MVSNVLSPTTLTYPEGEEQFLRFGLEGKIQGLLPISQLTEVLTIPRSRILPIPHTLPWVMGVYNWRGEILWIVNLGQLVGLGGSQQTGTIASSYKAIVLQLPSSQQTKDFAHNQTLGLVVNQIEDVEWCDPTLIELPSASTTSKIIPFLRGYYPKASGEALAVFAGDSILAAMPKS